MYLKSLALGLAMKTFPVILRLDEADYEALSSSAKSAGVSRSALLRTFLHNGLSGYDTKHEELLRRSEQIQATLMDVLEIAGVAAALVIRLDGPRVEERVRLERKMDDGFEGSQVVMRRQQSIKRQRQGK